MRLAGAAALALLVPGLAVAQQQTTAPQQRSDQDPATAPTRTQPERNSTEDRVRREIFREVLKAIPGRRPRAPAPEPTLPAPEPTAPVPGAAAPNPPTTRPPGSSTPAAGFEAAPPRIAAPPPPPRRAPRPSGTPAPAPRSEPRTGAQPAPEPKAAPTPPLPPVHVPTVAPPPEPAAAPIDAPAAAPAAKGPAAPPSPPPSQIAASPFFSGFARRIGWPLLALLAVIAAAAAGWQWRKRRILAHTRGALALSPSIDLSQGHSQMAPLGLAAPPLTMRARLEMGAVSSG